MINSAQGTQYISAKMHDLLTFGEDAKGLSDLHPANHKTALLSVVKTGADSTVFMDTSLYLSNDNGSLYAGNVSISLIPNHIEHVMGLIAEKDGNSGLDYIALPDFLTVDAVMHADGHHAYSPVSTGERIEISFTKINVVGDTFSLLGHYKDETFITAYITARELALGDDRLTRVTFAGNPELLVHVGNSEYVRSSDILDRITVLSHVLDHHIEGGFDNVVELTGGELSFRMAMAILNNDTTNDVVDDLVDHLELTVIDRELEYDRFPKR